MILTHISLRDYNYSLAIHILVALSLHYALPIFPSAAGSAADSQGAGGQPDLAAARVRAAGEADRRHRCPPVDPAVRCHDLAQVVDDHRRGGSAFESVTDPAARRGGGTVGGNADGR